MKTRKLILKSLLFYWRTNLGVFFGVAISTAIIVGALVVGDSVRFSLRQITLDRLGRIEYAIASGDRFFRSALAGELADREMADLYTAQSGHVGRFVIRNRFAGTCCFRLLSPARKSRVRCLPDHYGGFGCNSNFRNPSLWFFSLDRSSC